MKDPASGTINDGIRGRWLIEKKPSHEKEEQDIEVLKKKKYPVQEEYDRSVQLQRHSQVHNVLI